MKSRRISIPLLLGLAACTSGAAGWSSDVCGCIEAWESLAYSLKVQPADAPEELTISAVQAASARFVGQPLKIKDLPNTGMMDSCKSSPLGATCEWKIWERQGAYKGYIAQFHAAPDGKITAVSVSEHVWR